MLLNKQSNDWWLETSWRSRGDTVITTQFRCYKWLRLQWESVEVSLVQVMACRLFGAKPLPGPVEGPVIWNAMPAMLRPCNNNAVITVITTRVVFIHAMRWSQGPHNGACGIRNVFCLKCSHCCVYLSVLEMLQPVTPGNPLSPIDRLWVRAGYPNQETKWRWSDHRSHQQRYAISSTHLNDQRHIWIYLYLTDRICNGKSFQILGFYIASTHILLFVFKIQGDVGEIR